MGDYNRINYCQDEAPLPDPFAYPVQYSVFACTDTTRKLRLAGGNTEKEITEWNEDLTLELEHSHCLPDCVLVSISSASKATRNRELQAPFDAPALAPAVAPTFELFFPPSPAPGPGPGPGTLLQEFNIDTRCDGDQLVEGDQYGF